MRKWVEDHPVNKDKHPEREPGMVILSQPIGSDISFEFREKSKPLSIKYQMTRYQRNPEPNWGPKSRPSDTTVFGSKQWDRKEGEGDQEQDQELDQEQDQEGLDQELEQDKRGKRTTHDLSAEELNQPVVDKKSKCIVEEKGDIDMS
jgi:hypothetical protein